ncbi:UDP-glycosyltransferase 83A1-like [Bidens hawaiensis]|uniref:UDP-glycosyltransferase 83A1-like n=1 Tax=Bidens hawaiensis TaxID=980011 RepID=UPI00404AA32F
MTNTHVLVIPYPAQGHVIPLMEVSRCFINNGLKVTFVNTEFAHKRVMSAWSETDGPSDLMHMVTIPDGMRPCDDGDDLGVLTRTMFQLMPAKLEELINDINENDEEKITCIVADSCMGWVGKVAQKTDIRLALFSPWSAGVVAIGMSIQKLIDDGVRNSRGKLLKKQMVQLSTSMPLIDPTTFVWASMGDPVIDQVFFDFLFLEGNEAAEIANHIICNSSMELEPGVFTLFPKMLPIGPLLAINKSSRQVGHFWNEDSTCLTWLDQQPVNSVIYVAFGSITIFNQAQFEELALGLIDTKRPFLWVVRRSTSGTMDYAYPSGFMDSIGTLGKIVNWAPQQEILNHPSVACFMSHCGWNSTMEGVSNGVPFMCWPYFADQFFNKTYICDVWKTGIGLNKDDVGIVTRGEIKSKVEQLLNNDTIKQNALNLQGKVRECLGAGNSSEKNLNNFIDWVKEGNVDACGNVACK